MSAVVATSQSIRRQDEALGRAIRQLNAKAGERVGFELYPRTNFLRLTRYGTGIFARTIEADGATLLEALDRAADMLARGEWS